METKELIDWLRGYGTAKEGLGNHAVADLMYKSAARLEDLDRRVRIAEAIVEKLEHEMSYMNEHNEIGDRHEMGCW